MLNDILYGYAFHTILKGSAALGFTAGILGVFIITKKSSLMAGASASAALAGMLISAAFTGTRNGSVIMTAAGVMCLLSFFLAKFIADTLKINKFMVHGLIASVNFGLCMVLFTYLRQEKNALAAGMEKFILGEASTLMKSEADAALYVCAASVLITALCIKRFKAVLFSPELARTAHIPSAFYETLMFLMTAAVTIVGIQTVGILFMGALFVIPAVTAGLWTRAFIPAALISGLAGGISGAAGGFLSALQSNISSGPSVIIFAGLLLLISALLAPGKGLLIKKRAGYFYRPSGRQTK